MNAQHGAHPGPPQVAASNLRFFFLASNVAVPETIADLMFGSSKPLDRRTAWDIEFLTLVNPAGAVEFPAVLPSATAVAWESVRAVLWGANLGPIGAAPELLAAPSFARG